MPTDDLFVLVLILVIRQDVISAYFYLGRNRIEPPNDAMPVVSVSQQLTYVHVIERKCALIMCCINALCLCIDF